MVTFLVIFSLAITIAQMSQLEATAFLRGVNLPKLDKIVKVLAKGINEKSIDINNVSEAKSWLKQRIASSPDLGGTMEALLKEGDRLKAVEAKLKEQVVDQQDKLVQAESAKQQEASRSYIFDKGANKYLKEIKNLDPIDVVTKYDIKEDKNYGI